MPSQQRAKSNRRISRSRFGVAATRAFTVLFALSFCYSGGCARIARNGDGPADRLSTLIKSRRSAAQTLPEERVAVVGQEDPQTGSDQAPPVQRTDADSHVAAVDAAVDRNSNAAPRYDATQATWQQITNDPSSTASSEDEPTAQNSSPNPTPQARQSRSHVQSRSQMQPRSKVPARPATYAGGNPNSPADGRQYGRSNGQSYRQRGGVAPVIVAPYVDVNGGLGHPVQPQGRSHAAYQQRGPMPAIQSPYVDHQEQGYGQGYSTPAEPAVDPRSVTDPANITSTQIAPAAWSDTYVGSDGYPVAANGSVASGVNVNGAVLRHPQQTATELAIGLQDENDFLRERNEILLQEIAQLKLSVASAKKLAVQNAELLTASDRLNNALRDSVSQLKVRVQDLDRENHEIQRNADKALRDIEQTLDRVLVNSISQSTQ